VFSAPKTIFVGYYLQGTSINLLLFSRYVPSCLSDRFAFSWFFNGNSQIVSGRQRPNGSQYLFLSWIF
jgi:hypothetical protein